MIMISIQSISWVQLRYDVLRLVCFHEFDTKFLHKIINYYLFINSNHLSIRRMKFVKFLMAKQTNLVKIVSDTNSSGWHQSRFSR